MSHEKKKPTSAKQGLSKFYQVFGKLSIIKDVDGF